MNVNDFAKELNIPVDRLLEQLKAAGVSKAAASDAVSADGVAERVGVGLAPRVGVPEGLGGVKAQFSTMVPVTPA
jgi:hypothetical protein